MRKLWSTTVRAAAGQARRRHESRAAAYRVVDAHRANYQCGALRGNTVDVWVDERDGRGLQLYERLNFADEEQT